MKFLLPKKETLKFDFEVTQATKLHKLQATS